MKPRGVITFVFDDGYERVYQNAVPLLDKYGLKGVFALPLDGKKLERNEHRSVRPWQEWLGIRERGHEIASHSVNHINLTQLEPSALEHELKHSKETLNATTLVYPGGGFNPGVAQASTKYYRAARTVVRGFETLPPKNPYQLKSFNWRRGNFTVWKANLLAVWAHITNTWLIETFHMVDDNDTQMVHTVRTRDLDKHLAFVARLPVKVQTIHEVISNK
jgi:peptidoglycan/xylan/chitin deacetylase (PgdA/CDA1 family)